MGWEENVELGVAGGECGDEGVVELPERWRTESEQPVPTRDSCRQMTIVRMY